MGLEQRAAIKTGHESEGPSNRGGSRGRGAGGQWGPRALKPAPILSVIRVYSSSRFRPFLRFSMYPLFSTPFATILAIIPHDNDLLFLRAIVRRISCELLFFHYISRGDGSRLWR